MRLYYFIFYLRSKTKLGNRYVEENWSMMYSWMFPHRSNVSYSWSNITEYRGDSNATDMQQQNISTMLQHRESPRRNRSLSSMLEWWVWGSGCNLSPHICAGHCCLGSACNDTAFCVICCSNHAWDSTQRVRGGPTVNVLCCPYLAVWSRQWISGQDGCRAVLTVIDSCVLSHPIPLARQWTHSATCHRVLYVLVHMWINGGKTMMSGRARYVSRKGIFSLSASRTWRDILSCIMFLSIYPRNLNAA